MYFIIALEQKKNGNNFQNVYFFTHFDNTFYSWTLNYMYMFQAQ